MNLNEILKTEICRLCLARTKTSFSLIRNDGASSMLETLTSMKIQSSDEISTVMCLKCRLNLTLAYNIQQNMLKAEHRFRERLVKKELSPVPVEEDLVVFNETISNEVLIKQEPTKRTPKKEKNLETIDFGCEICARTFPTRTLLSRHKYNHVKRKCPICGKELTAPNLRNHVKSHTEGPQICELCGVTLKTKGNLRQHMFYSHNASRHKCDYCDKVFKKRSNRDAHQRKEHLGEANYVCDTCGKKFYSNRHLNTHVKMTHLKLRPYVCEFCNSAFSSLFAMKTHKRQHTNETPYRCEVCGEGYRQKVSLKSHLKSKHNIVEEETCKCSVCGKGFASKVALYSHQRIH